MTSERFKIYEEHPEFYQYSIFDNKTGYLEALSKEEYMFFLGRDIDAKYISNSNYIEIKNEANYVIFENKKLSETHTRFPRRVYFQITHQCNINCDYCFIKASKEALSVPKKLITDFAKYFAEKGLMEVRLTGGEPLLHPDFVEILDRFKDEGIYCSIATNGLWDERILKKLIKENNLWIIVSIDGGRENHNKLRRNTYDIIVKNLKTLREKNDKIRLRINTVLMKENREDIEQLAILADSLNTESITLIPLRPQVRVPAIKNQMLTADEFKSVLDNVSLLKQKYRVRFSTTIETDYKKILKTDSVFRKYSSCAAGREGLNIDYDYQKNRFFVYGCSYSPASDPDADPILREPFIAGGIDIERIDDFEKLWEDDNSWTIYRNLEFKAVECRNCTYWEKHLCTGACPIQNIDYEKLDLSIPLKEQLREQLSKTSEWYCYKRLGL